VFQLFWLIHVTWKIDFYRKLGPKFPNNEQQQRRVGDASSSLLSNQPVELSDGVRRTAAAVQ